MLPLIVKDYNWRQSIETIYISIPMKGIKKNNTSVITGDNYIRVHHHPYYFEVFLWGKVDDINGKCTLIEETSLILFELKKMEIGEWPNLQMDIQSVDRLEKHAIRTRAVEISQKRAMEQIKCGLARREANKQLAIEEQLKIDAASRERIASIRTVSTNKILNEFNDWKNSGIKKEKEEFIPEDEEISSVSSQSENTEENGSSQQNEDIISESVAKRKSEDQRIFLEGDTSSNTFTCSTGTNKDKLPSSKTIPGIRTSGKITVEFTAREFPTPSRESTAIEEEEWLKKQIEARKLNGFVDEDLRPEEKNPNWLLQKGCSLMEVESFKGAVSAFTTGIKLAPKMGELYAGRAKAHLALGNFRKSVEDASQGLELFIPKVDQNAKDRFLCHQIRAQAFFQLGLKEDCLIEIQAAFLLDPHSTHPELNHLMNVIKNEEDEHDH